MVLIPVCCFLVKTRSIQLLCELGIRFGVKMDKQHVARKNGKLIPPHCCEIYSSKERILLAGFPIIVAFSGTLEKTTEPDPIVAR
jgi:hypothetical protein